MKLKLKNPLLFFDIESTGTDIATDRIIELSVVKVHPDGHKDIKTRRFNPTIPIKPEAQKVHGISNEDLKDEPQFYQMAKSLAQFMKGCDIAGYNSTKFDVPMLVEEFLRAEEILGSSIDIDLRKRKMVDVQVIFFQMEPRTLTAAYQFYCGKDLTQAHSAEADTLATFEVLEGQLERYGDKLQNDIDWLADFTTRTRNLDFAGRIVLNEKDQPVFNFGKHKGRLVDDVLNLEPTYYSWMMNGDFTRDTKKVLTQIKLGNL
ncbi:MAG: 3'-5' exonuclease [Bacteroidales bacterium]|nr:3'-5' exonuclease [Bacteroidales bacterium]